MTHSVEIKWVQASDLPDEPGLRDRIAGFFKGESVDTILFEDEDDPWMAKRVLYAYLDPEDNKIVYIGKAWSTKVYDRFAAEDKEKLWDYLLNEIDLDQRDVVVLVGFPGFPGRSRLTKELLTDLEGLFIYQLEPCGNVQSKHGGKGRDGLICKCSGAWPLKRKTFVDE